MDFASRGSGFESTSPNGSAEQAVLHLLEEAGSKRGSVAGAVQHVSAGDLGVGEFPVHVTGGFQILKTMIRPASDPLQAKLLRRKQDRVVQGSQPGG